ncbi:glutamate racemase [Pseudoalteromonas sp. MMG012]|uniref:glutamate racemase n=1 Tax=Pseudoalteromonas sp. MMG012 TaxID=2822686 RepID=UPI001B39DFE7|nr:glutamate racemase [Pseudoalteromonas sp. MMG012]MBQ4852218.1 glutamate racemase [Pseudoalteromonas sp. MMG012]
MSPHVLVFDSGIGGTSILQHLESKLPHAQFSYVMDNALLPYGLQSETVIKSRLAALVTRIKELDLQVDLIVIACNTASTAALNATRQLTNIPIVGVVPAIKPGVLLSNSKHIALLATPATSSNAYTYGLIEEFAQNCKVDSHHSTVLVSLAEAAYWQQELDNNVVFAELQTLNIDQSVDVIVLGCTHFPILKAALTSFYGSNVKLVDSGEAIARRVLSILAHPNNTKGSSEERIKKPLQFYATAPDKIRSDDRVILQLNLSY